MMRLRIYGVFILSLLFGSEVLAQFKVTGVETNPLQVIRENLVGEGVEILSVKYHGHENSIGTFESGMNTGGHPDGIGIGEGLVITSGKAESINKTVNEGLKAEPFEPEEQYDMNDPMGNAAQGPNHPNLVKLANGAQIQDFSIIEVKFIPETDTFRLNYVWASEEYPYFVCSGYNDQFGFIISGKGINGDFNNAGKNIAIIPEVNLPVTINNLNDGTYIAGFHETIDPKNCAQEALNGETKKFFINNLKYGVEARPAFNGYTIPLEAKAAVVPCEEYTIQLIVADIGDDDKQDSGVFFERGSFRTATAHYTVVTSSGDNTIAEGCDKAVFKFNANNRYSNDLSLEAKLNESGDIYAKLGVDYTMKLNGTPVTKEKDLVLASNTSELEIEIEAIEDNIQEGVEQIVLSFRKAIFINPDAQCDDRRDSVIIFIKDNKLEAIDLPEKKSICKGAELELDGSVTTQIGEGKLHSTDVSIPIEKAKENNISTIEVSGEEGLAIGANSYPEVCIDVKHRNPVDLSIFIVSPNGKEMELASNVGKEFVEPDFKGTCFTPSASQSIKDGSGTYTGQFLPTGKYENLNGATVNGTWTLRVDNSKTGSLPGTLEAWSIKFSNQYKYTYSWTPTSDISNPSEGKISVKPQTNTKYKLSITDTYGCIHTDSTDVEVTPGNIYQHATTNNVCHGESKGEVSFSSSDSGMKYTWKDNNASDNKRTGLKAGTYELTIEGTSGCKTDTMVVITQPEKLIVASTTKDAGCQGESKGEIKLEVSGGTPNYSITWEDGSQPIFERKNLGAGEYKAKIEDKNGCTSPITVEVMESIPFKVEEEERNVSCPGANDGSIKLSFSGNTKDISVSWTNPGGFSSAETSIDKLKPGEYQATIVEEEGCTITRNFTIIEPEAIVFTRDSSHIKCHGESTGSIRVDVERGGTQPYMYSIDDGANYVDVNIFTALSAGTYKIRVKDANGCQTSDINHTVTLDQPIETTIQLDSIYNIVYGESATLEADPSIGKDAIKNITWTPEDYLTCPTCLKTDAKPEYTTVYELTLTDTVGCDVKKRAIVNVDRTPRVNMPNAFSPNGDHVNDFVYLMTDDVLVKRIEGFQIYDRWGALVFDVKDVAPNDEALRWNGKFNGRDTSPGVYIWMAHITLQDDVKKVYKGTITVVR